MAPPAPPEVVLGRSTILLPAYFSREIIIEGTGRAFSTPSREAWVATSNSYWCIYQFPGAAKSSLRAVLKQLRHNMLPKRASKGDMNIALLRAQCGQLCYRRQSTADLKAIARGRLKIRGRMIKAELVALLQDADTNACFSYLFDLPPEIRNLVYVSYVEGFPGHIPTPAQPPLARVNQQLREEVLPVFYDVVSILLDFEPPKPGQSAILPTDKTMLFLSHIPTPTLPLMGKVTFRYRTEWPLCGFSVVYDPMAGKFQVTFLGYNWEETKNPPVYADSVRDVVDQISQRGLSSCLSVVDVYTIRKAIEAGEQSAAES